MAKTLISDVIVPHLFAPYVIERTATLSELIASGIAERTAEFDALANAGGQTVSMPFWKEITGADEVLSDSADLALAPITSGKDISVILNRGKAWSVNDLAKWLSGDDPAEEIVNMIAGFWARATQTTLLKILFGLFDTSGELATTHRVNIYNDVATGAITDAMRLTGETFIDGLTKLGDANRKLTSILIHSEVEALLKKRDLLDFVPDSEGKSQIMTFQGRRVVVDDGAPKVAGSNSPAYTSYLFGQGAFAWGEATLDPNEAIETDRNVLGSDDVIASRRRYILHPRGVKWVGTPAGSSPTNDELATEANWTKVYLDKNIPIVAVRHNV